MMEWWQKANLTDKAKRHKLRKKLSLMDEVNINHALDEWMK